MSEPFLIAHVVSGEPAFDIAEKMTCPLCSGEGCAECDDADYWWICSTSGHRAYPYWYFELSELLYDEKLSPHEYSPRVLLDIVPDPPPSWPDHYPKSSPEPAKPKVRSLLQALGLVKPIERRI